MRGETNITSVVMGGVEQRLDSHTLGNAVLLTSYTSSNNQYTFPSDGYVMVLTGDQVNDTVLCDICDKSLIQAICYVANFRTRNTVNVKKGMTIYVSSNTGNRGNVYYYPLT